MSRFNKRAVYADEDDLPDYYDTWYKIRSHAEDVASSIRTIEHTVRIIVFLLSALVSTCIGFVAASTTCTDGSCLVVIGLLGGLSGGTLIGLAVSQLILYFAVGRKQEMIYYNLLECSPRQGVAFAELLAEEVGDERFVLKHVRSQFYNRWHDHVSANIQQKVTERREKEALVK